MRCIEMQLLGKFPGANNWLIETWDVLKFCLNPYSGHAVKRLIETWDVLKLYDWNG